jgi:hypothetical protein
VGVDCHSRFFQLCLLIPEGARLTKLERPVPASWPELRAARDWLLRALGERGIAVDAPDLRYTCESTGLYHMPLCLAWRGRPAIINPSDQVEEIGPPGGPYLSLGEEVDLEVEVRTFQDKNHQACWRLRIARVVGEF